MPLAVWLIVSNAVLFSVIVPLAPDRLPIDSAEAVVIMPVLARLPVNVVTEFAPMPIVPELVTLPPTTSAPALFDTVPLLTRLPPISVMLSAARLIVPPVLVTEPLTTRLGIGLAAFGST